MAPVMHSMMLRGGPDCPIRDRLSAICGRLRIVSGLRYLIRRRLSLCRRRCRFLGGRVSASRSLIGLIRGVDGALFRRRLVRRTPPEQRKGQHSPGEPDKY
jgi:hypothetical protein